MGVVERGQDEEETLRGSRMKVLEGSDRREILGSAQFVCPKDETCMNQMRFRFPSIFGARVSFPRDQVLSSTRCSSMSTDGIHLVFFFSFDDRAR